MERELKKSRERVCLRGILRGRIQRRNILSCLTRSAPKDRLAEVLCYVLCYKSARVCTRDETTLMFKGCRGLGEGLDGVVGMEVEVGIGTGVGVGGCRGLWKTGEE